MGGYLEKGRLERRSIVIVDKLIDGWNIDRDPTRIRKSSHHHNIRLLNPRLITAIYLGPALVIFCVVCNLCILVSACVCVYRVRFFKVICGYAFRPRPWWFGAQASKCVTGWEPVSSLR